MSQYLAITLRGANEYLRSFEQALAREARHQGLDGVICGRVHKPEMREIDGMLYCNDGDWVEHQSALVEELLTFFKVKSLASILAFGLLEECLNQPRQFLNAT